MKTANQATDLPDLFAKLTDDGDFYLVHPLTDKGREWFAHHISDAHGFTYVRQREADAVAFSRARNAGLRTMIDCGIGLPPADILAHLPANIATYLRTADQRIPRKSAGQLAYERDVARKPTYHDGTPRPAWESLDDVKRLSWERNPTDRTN